jgi:hypothetical protein
LDVTLQGTDRSVGKRLEEQEKTDVVKRLVEAALLNALAKMSRGRQLDSMMQQETLGLEKSRKRWAGEPAIPLPITDLTPREVIESGLVEMSLSQLYRATQQGRFYCSFPRGRSHGKLYPAWQFVPPVTDMLPEVLSVLQERGESYVHARMISEEDELNELSPAEVLAGRSFSARTELHPMQAEMLELPTPERLALVKEVFKEPSRQHAIG